MTTTTTARATLSNVADFIAARKTFTCNRTLTGGYFNEGVGRLSEPRHTGFYRATEADDFYAVYSYATPIAWYAHATWTVPTVKYSVTTSRHQNIVRGAVSE